MSTSTLGLFLRHLALSEEVSRLGTTSDRNLLAAYESGSGHAAFTELMRRHGPMVLRTCRRVLGQGPDAEDAFQATFVLLARKAGSIGKREALGSWLHRVAYRTAVDVLTGAIRRRAHERQAAAMTHSDPDPAAKATWNEIQPILDAELDALPDEARRLLIACYLQDKTHAEAAAELGLPQGSIAWNLQRARTLLAKRLARRGITVSALLLAILLEDSAKGAGVPAVLLVHTLEAARTFTEQTTGIVSDHVARLVKGGLAQMSKGWTHLSVVLAGWVGLLGAGLIACQTLKAWPDKTPDSEPPATPAAERLAQEVKKAVRTDCFGDPLPPGALARMGTVRLSNDGYSIEPSTLLAFSPDGKLLASLLDQRIVVLWDAVTGKEMRRFTSDEVKGSIASLGFSPDGKTLVTSTSSYGLYLWDAATGELLRTSGVDYPGRGCVPGGTDRVAVLPDGRMLAVADGAVFKDGKENGPKEFFYVWDIAPDKEVRQLKLSDPKKIGWLSLTAFSPDGKLLATVGARKDANGELRKGDSDISVWDVAMGKEICRLSLDKRDRAIKLAFSRDGKMLASLDGVGWTVSVWDTATGKLVRRLQAPSDLQADAPLAFSPDGKTLVGGYEGHLWEVSSGKEIRSLGLKIARVALFSPDGKSLAVGDKAGVIRLWDMATGKEIFPHPGHRQCIQAVAYSPDGKMLASTGASEAVCLWDVATGKELRQLPRHTSSELTVESIAYSPDGKMLAFPDGDVVRLWEGATGKEIHQLDVPERIRKEAIERSFSSVRFSPDGKKLATGTRSGMVVLWEAATGKEIYTLTPGASLFSTPAVVFSPDGRMLATPGKDNTVSFWEVATGRLVSQLGGLKTGQQGGDQSVQYLAFSPDGRVVATSSSEDDKVRLWEVASGKERGQLDGYKHRGDGKRSRGQLQGCVLTFSPDGRMLATAVPGRYFDAADLAVTLWDVATGKEIARLAGHRNCIRTLAFSPDGKTLASGSDDLTCLVWDVNSFVQQLKLARPLTPQTLSRKQLEAAWTDLASDDPAKAYRAVSVLQAAPKQAVLLLQARVRPVALADPKQLTRLIADLDDSNFKVREKAQREIVRMGELAVPALRRALADRPSLEMKRRLQALLATLEPKLVTTSAHRWREVRSVQVLESMATAESRQLLQDLAKGLAGVSLTREAQAALERLDKRSASRP